MQVSASNFQIEVPMLMFVPPRFNFHVFHYIEQLSCSASIVTILLVTISFNAFILTYTIVNTACGCALSVSLSLCLCLSVCLSVSHSLCLPAGTSVGLCGCLSGGLSTD